MGLFDKFRKPSRPEALDVSAPAGTVLAPVAGDVITLENVPDPVFSSGVMGRGCGIEPTGEVVYAPVAGMLSAIGAPQLSTPVGIHRRRRCRDPHRTWGSTRVEIEVATAHGLRPRRARIVRAGEPLLSLLEEEE